MNIETAENVIPETALPAKVEKIYPKFDLNLHTHRLMLQEPFLGVISRKIDKIATESIPTAAVRFNEQRCCFEMLYNPKFMATLSDEHKLGVLKHEFYHIIFEHVSGRFKPTGKIEAYVWNHATDLAINSFLENELPESCLFPGRAPYQDFPKFQTSEWYYGMIKDAVDKGMKDLEGLMAGVFDDHSFWGNGEPGKDGNGSGGEMAKEIMKQILEDAYGQVRRGAGWGSCPAQVQKQISDYLASMGKIDWKSVLAAFIRGSVRSDKTSSVRKINRRFPRLFPGKKVRRTCNLAICIDNSGSVSTDLIERFFAECHGLSQLATFWIVNFDCEEVQEEHVWKWTKGTNPTITRVLTGGTDFSVCTRYCNKSEKRFDAMIVMTDLAASRPISSRIPRLWIASEEDAKTPYFDLGNEILLRI